MMATSTHTVARKLPNGAKATSSRVLACVTPLAVRHTSTLRLRSCIGQGNSRRVLTRFQSDKAPELDNPAPSSGAQRSESSSQTTFKCDIAIIGGGLGGLALAAGLRSRGYDVYVFEAAAQLRTGAATMVGLGASAFAALDWLHPGIMPELMPRGAACKEVSYAIRANKSQEMTVMSVPQLGRFTIRWSEAQQVLAELVPPEAVRCGYRATGYTEDGGRVRVHFKDMADVECRFAVAADGVRSSLRATMLPGDPGPRYLGQMCWNMVLYNPNGSVVAAHKPEESLIYADKMTNDERSLSCVVSDAGGGFTYVAVVIRSASPAFTPQPNAANRPTPANQPYVAGGGKGRLGSKARLERLLEDAGWEIPLKMVQATPESEIFERALLDRVPLDELGATMSSPGGRVVLLGDAAHAMHPGPGQGARTAFEDAHTLAQMFEAHRGGLSGWAFDATTVTNSTDTQAIAKLVTEYESARLLRTCRVQRFSAEGCGLASIRDTSRPPDIPSSGPVQIERGMEFLRWMDQYPAKPTGDPDSLYWKPL